MLKKDELVVGCTYWLTMARPTGGRNFNFYPPLLKPIKVRLEKGSEGCMRIYYDSVEGKGIRDAHVYYVSKTDEEDNMLWLFRTLEEATEKFNSVIYSELDRVQEYQEAMKKKLDERTRILKKKLIL